MKLNAKLFAAALALPLLLAACGSASTPEGTVKFNALKTEFKDQAGNYVACDNSTGSDNNAKQTAVGIYYSASGTVDSIDVGLRGANGNIYDGNYNKNVSGSSLQNIGGNDFKTVFYADSSTGFLPQAIIVNPSGTAKVKIVNPTGKIGSFYAVLKINTASGNASTNSRLALLLDIPVYSNCTVTSTTTETL